MKKKITKKGIMPEFIPDIPAFFFCVLLLALAFFLITFFGSASNKEIGSRSLPQEIELTSDTFLETPVVFNKDSMPLSYLITIYVETKDKHAKEIINAELKRFEKVLMVNHPEYGCVALHLLKKKHQERLFSELLNNCGGYPSPGVDPEKRKLPGLEKDTTVRLTFMPQITKP